MHGSDRLPTLFERVQQHARERPTHVAVWQRLPGGAYEATSYSELAATACRFAHLFTHHLGAVRFVPLCLARSSSCIAAMLGAMGAGKAFICLKPNIRLRQLSHILEAVMAQAVLVDAAGLMTLRGELAEAPAVTQVQWWLLHAAELEAMHQKIIAKLGENAIVDPGASQTVPLRHGLPLYGGNRDGRHATD